MYSVKLSEFITSSDAIIWYVMPFSLGCCIINCCWNSCSWNVAGKCSNFKTVCPLLASSSTWTSVTSTGSRIPVVVPEKPAVGTNVVVWPKFCVCWSAASVSDSIFTSTAGRRFTLFPECVNSCLRSFELFVKHLLQRVQQYGFSPVWLLKCILSWLDRVKLFWHSEHT